MQYFVQVPIQHLYVSLSSPLTLTCWMISLQLAAPGTLSPASSRYRPTKRREKISGYGSTHTAALLWKTWFVLGRYSQRWWKYTLFFKQVNKSSETQYLVKSTKYWKSYISIYASNKYLPSLWGKGETHHYHHTDKTTHTHTHINNHCKVFLVYSDCSESLYILLKAFWFFCVTQFDWY